MTLPENIRRLVLVLEAKPDDGSGIPPLTRLRNLFKRMGRNAGWRVVSAQPETEEQPDGGT